MRETFARLFSLGGSAEQGVSEQGADLVASAQAWFTAPVTADSAELTRLIVRAVQLGHDARAALDLPGARVTDAVRLV